MIKERAYVTEVGDLAWSCQTGLGEMYPVTEIDLTGPRAPYFTLKGVKITYRDVTPKKAKIMEMIKRRKRNEM